MIDSMQNWFLTNIEEDDGYTVMEFYRNITSCDNEKDLNILVRTFSLFLLYSHSTIMIGRANDNHLCMEYC